MTQARGRTVAIAIVAIALVTLSGCSGVLGGDPQPRLTFENVTAEASLDYQGSGSGVGAGNNAIHVADVDRDGWDDLLAIGGERPALFWNTGGAFERSSSFPALDGEFKSGTFVDYDGDGFEDLVLFRPNGTAVALHNDEGAFERDDVGLDGLTYPLGATAADYDADGDVDLFVYQSGSWSERRPLGHFSASFQVEDDNGNPNVLFENVGGTFERVDDAGIEGDRWSLAASFADFTGDGLPDVHVANDYNNDTLYVNEGDGTFEQRLLGASTARNGMASEVADVNGDGLMDVFVTNIYIPLKEHRNEMSPERYARLERLFTFVIQSGRTEGNTLLINQGDGDLVDRAEEYGVRHGGWGWAASLTDFDNDGDRDLLHVTQEVVRVDRDDPRWTYPMLWQRNDTAFARVDKSVHGMAELNSRGMATLDYDHDGDRDVVIATYDGPVVLYENTVDAGTAVAFEVVGSDGVTAHGATVTVEAEGVETVVQQTDENDFFSQESRAKHVGLDGAESATLSVTWPDGTEGTFDVDADRRYRISPSDAEVVADLTGDDDSD